MRPMHGAGIAGHSAYFGGYYVRGDADSPAVSNVLDAGILANLPELPADGRMHLLKVVLAAQDAETGCAISGSTATSRSRRLIP